MKIENIVDLKRTRGVSGFLFAHGRIRTLTLSSPSEKNIDNPPHLYYNIPNK